MYFSWVGALVKRVKNMKNVPYRGEHNPKREGN